MEISVGINPEFRTTAERRGIKLIKKWPHKALELGELGSALHAARLQPGEAAQVVFVQNCRAGMGMGRAGRMRRG